MSRPTESQLLDVLNGNTQLLMACSSEELGQSSLEGPICLLAGSFNPLHEGHRQMASFGSAQTGLKTVLELCVTNVDKSALTLVEARKRLNQDFSPFELMLTRTETFVEKAQLFPNSVLLVGADTMARIAQTKYYDGCEKNRDRAIESISGSGCRFLVFGREFPDGRFNTLSDLKLPEKLIEISDEVSEVEFRMQISSSQIRNSGL